MKLKMQIMKHLLIVRIGCECGCRVCQEQCVISRINERCARCGGRQVAEGDRALCTSASPVVSYLAPTGNNQSPTRFMVARKNPSVSGEVTAPFPAECNDVTTFITHGRRNNGRKPRRVARSIARSPSNCYPRNC